MGVSEGKLIGEWFGPNTVAHVLKKLTVYDDWSSLAIHVAMDSVVVLDHVRVVCQTKPRHSRSVSSSSGGHNTFEFTESSSGGGPVAKSDAKDPPNEGERTRSDSSSAGGGSTGLSWRPLLLIVPLRLGLSNLNPVYIPALKVRFAFVESLILEDW